MNSFENIDPDGYLKYFGLSANPFPIVPDADALYVSANIEEIITELLHGIHARKGFMVLTGEVGLGKTTISRRLLMALEENAIETALVFHTGLNADDLLKEICVDFGVSEMSDTPGDAVRRLNEFLLQKNSAGKNCAIIIDDAQNLSMETLERLRLLSNLETNKQKLVQILLIGQPELMDVLSDPMLRQLKSRIVITKHVKPLSAKEVQAYIQFKLDICGGSGRIRIKHAVSKKVHGITGGNFRQINLLMDRALYSACAAGQKDISPAHINSASADIFTSAIKEKPKHRHYMPLISALFFICAVIAAGLYYRSSFFPETSTAKPIAATEKPTQPIPESQPAVSPYAKAARAFLAPFAQESLADELILAMKSNMFSELKHRLYTNEGLSLILLSEVPDYIKNNFGILSYTPPDAPPVHLVLWKPEFYIPHFYYQYAGEEIKLLQEKLAAIGLYMDKIDGVVGKHLMKAVVAYQKTIGMTVTGIPDEKTVFFLCQHERTRLT